MMYRLIGLKIDRAVFFRSFCYEPKLIDYFSSLKTGVLSHKMAVLSLVTWFYKWTKLASRICRMTMRWRCYAKLWWNQGMLENICVLFDIDLSVNDRNSCDVPRNWNTQCFFFRKLDENKFFFFLPKNPLLIGILEIYTLASNIFMNIHAMKWNLALIFII